MKSPSISNKRIALVAFVWTFLVGLSLESWYAYIILPVESRPDRLHWIDTLLLIVHAAASAVIAAIPLLTLIRFRQQHWSFLLNRASTLLNDWLYHILLIMAAVLVLYLVVGTYVWLMPIVRLTLGVVIGVGMSTWLLLPPEVAYPRTILSLVWGVNLLALCLAYAAFSNNWQIVTGVLISFFLSLPILLAVPPVARGGTLILKALYAWPAWAIGMGLLIVPVIFLLNAKFAFFGTTWIVIEVLLTALAAALCGLLALRSQTQILNELIATSRTLHDLLVTGLIICMCGMPWLLPTTANTILWKAKTVGRTSVLHPAIELYPFDITFLGVLLLLGASLVNKSFRAAFAATLRRSIVLLGGAWWAILALLTVVSLGWAQSRALAGHAALRLALGMLFAVVVAHLVVIGRARILLLATVTSGIFQSIVAIGENLRGEYLGLTWLGELNYAPNLHPYRSSGLTVHPNSLSFFLMIVLFCSIALLRDPRANRVYRLVAWNGVGSVILGLMMAASRNVIASTLAAAGLMMVLTARSVVGHIQINRRYLPVYLLAGGLVLVVLAFASETAFARFGSFQDNPNYFVDRLTLGYQDTFALVRANPVLGVGAGNVLLALDQFTTTPGQLIAPAHNSFLLLWAEYGTLGFVILILAGLVTARAMIFTCDRSAAALAFGCLGVVLSLNFDIVVLDPRLQMLCFWLLGLWYGYRLLAVRIPTTYADN